MFFVLRSTFYVLCSVFCVLCSMFYVLCSMFNFVASRTAARRVHWRRRQRRRKRRGLHRRRRHARRTAAAAGRAGPAAGSATTWMPLWLAMSESACRRCVRQTESEERENAFEGNSKDRKQNLVKILSIFTGVVFFYPMYHFS